MHNEISDYLRMIDDADNAHSPTSRAVYADALILAIRDYFTDDELIELAKAKAKGRLVVLPEGYEHAEELYHVVNLPKWCDEDGNGCEDCRHEVCNGDGASIDCTFKPYVSKIGANAVFDALYTLNGLSLSKESAEKALGGTEDETNPV